MTEKLRPTTAVPVTQYDRDRWFEEIMESVEYGDPKITSYHSGDSMVFAKIEDEGIFSVYDVQIRRVWHSWEAAEEKSREVEAVKAKLTDSELALLGLTRE